MKTIYSLLIGFAFLSINSCNNVSNTDLNVYNSEITLGIEGMVCEYGCAKTIEKKMAEVQGINEAAVDFNEKSAKIRYNNKLITGIEIKKRIEGMNEGQYSVDIISDRQISTKNSPDAVNNSKDKASIQERSFSFPQLLTYFKSNL